ncbi:4-hydroxyphenylacetate decarboxylase large subunit [Candidatus Binatia bacterium]|nr:4-hydroxyphenylacetate decarboxylase large subunit [Candidatus Binatia bacterium]
MATQAAIKLDSSEPTSARLRHSSSKLYNRYGDAPSKTVTPREVIREPGQRARALRDLYFDAKSSVNVEFTYWYSRTWEALDGELPMVRRAEALKAAFLHLTPVIYPGELLVMGKAAYLRGSYPMPWLSESFFETWDDKRQREAREAGALSAGKVTTWGQGGGNVTHDLGNVMSIAGKFGIRREEVPILQQIAKTADGKSTADLGHKYEQYVPNYQEKEAIMRSVVCMYESGSAMPQGREVINHYYPLQYGIDGMIDICRKGIAEAAGNPDMERIYFYHSAILVLEGIQGWIRHYAEEARNLAALEEPESAQQVEYLEIAERLDRIASQPPQTFREALQLTWTFHLAVLNEDAISGLSPGRLGQVLYPFWKRDLDAGRITREATSELLECMRVKYTTIDLFAAEGLVGGVLSGNTFNNVSLGGLRKDGSSAFNELEMLILEAGISCGTTQPTLTILYEETLPEEFMLKAVECIKTGTGYPAIVNNRTTMDFIRENFADEGMRLEEARAWAMGGCLESSAGSWMPLTLDGKTYDIPGGSAPSAGIGVNFLSLPKMIELVLFDGIDKRTGERIFPSHGHALDSYEDLWAALQAYIRRAVDVLRRCNNIQCDIWGRVTPSIVNSMLKPDCLSHGKPISSRGARFNTNFHVKLESSVVLVNSLASLKKNVYEDRAFTLDDYRNAILANFGYKTAAETGSYSLNEQVKTENYHAWERIHRASLEAPKFGNDDPFVDEIFKQWQQWVCRMAHDYVSIYDRPLYVGQISVSTHGPMGAVTLASADGRLCGTTFTDGSVSAYPGTDRNGPYALFNSASCFDHSMSQSTQLNVKIHPLAVTGKQGAKKFLDLIRGYMRTGAFHIQFNVVDSRMLKDAQEHPENYRGLMVRVAGFTNYWAELGKQIQDEIIARTEYEEIS